MLGPRAKSEQDEQAKGAPPPGLTLGPDTLQRKEGPVYRQLYLSIKDAILAGTFPNGARLPSSRSLATQLGLSRTTVDLAYNLLAGDGLVQGRTAQGTVVTSTLPRPARMPTAGTAAAPGPDAASPGPLAPDAAAIDVFPRKAWSRLATRHAKNLLPADMVPHDRAGHPRLREAIANRVRLVRGIVCEPSQVFVTQGPGASLLLVASALGLAGQAVHCDARELSPALRSALDLVGATLVPLSADDADGEPAPPSRLAICQPADLPTIGEPWRADALLAWAREQGAWLLECDGDLDLYQPGPHEARLAHGLAAERSIYLGSFERSVFPEVGCGFIVVPRALVERFADAARHQAWHAPVAVQRTLCDFITQGYIGRHANRLRRAHAERRKAALAALRKGSFTARLAFQTAGPCLAASLAAVADATSLSQALAASGLGARLVAPRRDQDAMLLVGYAGAPRDALVSAIVALDALLTRACRPAT